MNKDDLKKGMKTVRDALEEDLEEIRKGEIISAGAYPNKKKARVVDRYTIKCGDTRYFITKVPPENSAMWLKDVK